MLVQPMVSISKSNLMFCSAKSMSIMFLPRLNVKFLPFFLTKTKKKTICNLDFHFFGPNSNLTIQFATEVPTFQANQPLKRRPRRTLEPCPNLASTTTQVPRVSTWWKDGTLWLFNIAYLNGGFNGKIIYKWPLMFGKWPIYRWL